MPNDKDLERIAKTCDNLKSVLIAKNTAYGGSAFSSPLLCPAMPSGAAILVRASDKIARLIALQGGANDNGEALSDTVMDLAGYCVLYLSYLEKVRENNDRE